MNLYNLIHTFSHDFKNQAVDLHSYFFFLLLLVIFKYFVSIQNILYFTVSILCKVVMFFNEIGLEMLPRSQILFTESDLRQWALLQARSDFVKSLRSISGELLYCCS